MKNRLPLAVTYYEKKYWPDFVAYCTKYIPILLSVLNILLQIEQSVKEFINCYQIFMGQLWCEQTKCDLSYVIPHLVDHRRFQDHKSIPFDTW